MTTTAERVRELLTYDAETGQFYWKPGRKGVHARLQRRAGGVARNGYILISVDDKRYYAHRLAWLCMTGEWPKDEVDHRNGVRTDNRWANLREANRQGQSQNMATPSNNTSGYRGVTWNRALSKWQAQIGHCGRQRHLGLFATPESAHEAYLEAKRELHTFEPSVRESAKRRELEKA